VSTKAKTKVAPAKSAAKSAKLVSGKASATAKKPVSKPASKPAPKAAAKPAPKPAAKSVAKGKAAVTAKPAAKKAVKPVAKPAATKAGTKVASKAATSSAKSASKSPVKVAAKPAARALPAKQGAKAPLKPSAKSASQAVVKETVKALAKKPAPAPAKPAAKAAAKPAAKSEAKPALKLAPVASAKAAAKEAAKSAVKPAEKAPTSAVAPAKVATGSPVLMPIGTASSGGIPRAGRPSSRLASLTVPSMAQSVASTAAKASYAQIESNPMIAPPLPSSIKKDPKLANNWKSTPADKLSDAELMAMPDAEYMNDKQLAAFRHRLVQLKNDILASAGETTEHLREDTVVVPDPADRATIEEEHALELRTRDRERKLLKKIEQSITRIDAGDYGYCDETGEPIGVGRLLARPTATLSLEAQQRRELKQKMFGD